MQHVLIFDFLFITYGCSDISRPKSLVGYYIAFYSKGRGPRLQIYLIYIIIDSLGISETAGASSYPTSEIISDGDFRLGEVEALPKRGS